MAFKSKAEKIGYLRGFFDGEGTVTGLKEGSYKGSRRVGICNTDYDVIILCQKLLLELGIRTKLYKRKIIKSKWKQAWDLNIFEKENIEKYAKKIGFAITSKQIKLDKIIGSYKEQIPCPPKEEVELRYLSQKLSYKELMKIWGYKSTGSICHLLERYGIKARSYSEAGKISWGKRIDNRMKGRYRYESFPFESSA